MKESLKDKITFEDICTMLVYHEPFTLARYGDGEFRAITGHDGVNCDGHEYFSDMSRRLANILESRPDYYLAWHLDKTDTDREEIEEHIKQSGWDDIHWHGYSGLFHDAIHHDKIDNFIKSLEGHNVLLVGPKYLEDIIPCEFIEVPKVNCWKDSRRIMQELFSKSWDEYERIVLFCCSMAANVWIHDCHKWDRFHTLIDLGCGLDYHAKNPIRSFIRKKLQ